MIEREFKKGDVNDMTERDFLLELEEPLRRISCGINAVELMVQGLGRVMDPYADGFHAIWDYLWSAESAVQEVVALMKSSSGGQNTDTKETPP